VTVQDQATSVQTPIVVEALIERVFDVFRAQEAMHEAMRLIRTSYVTMIETWAAQQES